MDQIYLMNELDLKVREALALGEEAAPGVKEIDTILEMVMYFLQISREDALDLIAWADYTSYASELQIKLNDLHRTCRHYVI